MEAGRNMLSSSPSFPLRTHLRNGPSSSSSVSVLHEKATFAVTSAPNSTTSLSRHFPTSVHLQEQRDESRTSLHLSKEERTPQVALDRRQIATAVSDHGEKNSAYSDQYLKDFESQFLHWPGLLYLLPSLQTGQNPSSSFARKSSKTNKEESMDVKPYEVLALAKKALSASKEAASLVEDSNLSGPVIYESNSHDLRPPNSANFLREERTVRSARLLERRSRRRRVSKPKNTVHVSLSPKTSDLLRKRSQDYDPNEALRLFLWGPETTQLLTAKEESEVMVQIQSWMRLEEVKMRLQYQFNREPTLVEWAAAVGISCRELKEQLHCGNISRDKLIYANFRLVVHIAKQYQNHGLSLQDLLQEGSRGLMRSVEKFKPQAGCKFATYAYWWIRQSIRKAIFQHSRIVRLPENVYSQLSKVLEARRLYIQEAHCHPTKEELAARAGISVEKLEKLLHFTRMPISMQQRVWSDQDTTFQEITADSKVEIPDVSVAKQLMRQHIRNLLGILSPRERRIIRMRFGIEDGKQKSLSDIGAVFGLSKERVRQLENRALFKLRQCLNSHGLCSYTDLLV